MPTRKQKRREAKSKRHDYEFVYVDDEGNEVEAPPEEAKTPKTSAPAKKQQPQARTGRARKTPQPPSWQRAGRRALILGAVVFVLFGMLNKNHNSAAALLAAVIYTALFIPFTYMLDRFAYNRWQARDSKTPTRKT